MANFYLNNTNVRILFNKNGKYLSNNNEDYSTYMHFNNCYNWNGYVSFPKNNVDCITFTNCSTYNQNMDLPTSLTRLSLSNLPLFNGRINFPDNINIISFSLVNSFNQEINAPNAQMFSWLSSNKYRFNKPVNIRNINTASYSFENASIFNSPIDITYVNYLNGTFNNCAMFNQPLIINGGIDVSSMLSGCPSFKSNLTFGPNAPFPKLIFNLPYNSSNSKYDFNICNTYEGWIKFYNANMYFGFDFCNELFGYAGGWQINSSMSNVSMSRRYISHISFNLYYLPNIAPYKFNNDEGTFGIFHSCYNFNGNVILNDQVKDIAYMFAYCSNFNTPFNIPNSVLNMSSCFHSCSSFNQPISIPNNCINLNRFLCYANNFNSTISFPHTTVEVDYSHGLAFSSYNLPLYLNAWGNFVNFLSNDKSFDQNIYYPPESKVPVRMFAMFAGMNYLNWNVFIPNSLITGASSQTSFGLAHYTPIGSPDVCTGLKFVINSQEFFYSGYGGTIPYKIYNNSSCTQLYNYETIIMSDVINITNCLADCIRFNAPISINDSVMYANRAFFNCTIFNQPITLPASLRFAENMFNNCTNFNQPLAIPYNLRSASDFLSLCNNYNSLVTISDGKLRSLANFFSGCTIYNKPIEISNNVVVTSGMFDNCTNFNQSVNLPSTVKISNDMFRNCVNLNSPIGMHDKLLNLVNMFKGCTIFNQPIVLAPCIFNAYSFLQEAHEFNQPVVLPKWATNLDGFHNMFYNCFKLNQTIKIPESWLSMSEILSAFYNCGSTSLILPSVYKYTSNSTLSTQIGYLSSNVKSISYYDCPSLNTSGLYDDVNKVYVKTCYQMLQDGTIIISDSGRCLQLTDAFTSYITSNDNYCFITPNNFPIRFNYDGYNLKTIIGKNVCRIAFSTSFNRDITIPSGVYDISQGLFNNAYSKNINFESDDLITMRNMFSNFSMYPRFNKIPANVKDMSNLFVAASGISIVYNANQGSNLSIPNGVMYIDNFMRYPTNYYGDINLPESVISANWFMSQSSFHGNLYFDNCFINSKGADRVIYATYFYGNIIYGDDCIPDNIISWYSGDSYVYTQKDVYPPKNCDIFYFGNHSTFNGNIHLSNQVRYFILNSNLNQFNTPLTIPESVKKLAINFNSIFLLKDCLYGVILIILLLIWVLELMLILMCHLILVTLMSTIMHICLDFGTFIVLIIIVIIEILMLILNYQTQQSIHQECSCIVQIIIDG